MKNRANPFLLGGLLTVMVASWSLNFVVGKIGLRHMPALTLATFRVELATLVLWLVYSVVSVRRRGLPRHAANSSSHKFWLDRRDFQIFVPLGLLGVVVNQICFIVGLSLTSAAHSSLIIAMGPIFVLLLAWFQRLETLTAKKLLGMAAAFSGVAVLAAEHGVSLHSPTLRGDLITFFGSLGFSLYTVFSKKVAEQYDSLTMNAYNYLVGGLLILPLAVHQAIRLASGPGWRSPGWAGWGAVAFTAIFASVIAYLIYFWALRYMAASRLATFSYIQPVAAALMGAAWLGEAVTHHLLFGGALILAGVYTIESGPREPNSEEMSRPGPISNS